MIKLESYTTASGETLLYSGHPNLPMLEGLAAGPGDVWHSSLDQGFRDAFPDLMFQTSVLFWYLNDFEGLDQCISWRIHPNFFVVRKEVWELAGGFDEDFSSVAMAAFDFGFRLLRYMGGIPLYVKGLFSSEQTTPIVISRKDRYLFFRKNFKTEHSIYLMFRKGMWHPGEWNAFLYARRTSAMRSQQTILPPRSLRPLKGTPTVSYVIPTMMRQEHTRMLLADLAAQTYPPSEVVIVDATPEEQRQDGIYQKADCPFPVKVEWQQSKGSCRARNEAILQCTGDYIIFGDDDIRIPPDFVENHLRLLQTYGTAACNGLDIRADNVQQGLNDLQRKLGDFGPLRFRVGATTNFSNANSCVETKMVHALVGNDVNFDGGYGEDSDFGLSLTKAGAIVLFNPFSANLHLKPPVGGYRWWGAEALRKGKKRKAQPWELGRPVGRIRPVPSPTVLYGVLKQFSPPQVREYRAKNLTYFVFRGNPWRLPLRIVQLPYKWLQFKVSLGYARRLMELGPRFK